MKKRVKVFQAGKYPQGEYSLDRVKKIFGDVKESVKGAYNHTKTAINAGTKPVPIGNFSEFSIDDNGVVMADIEFNDKGEGYYNDGIMGGISVEITNKDKLKQIAILPLGINPAVAGAEFSENGTEYLEVVEFEEIGKTMGIEEIIKAIGEAKLEDRLEIIKAIGRGITQDQKQAFRAVSYEFAEIVKEEKGMTKEEFSEFAKKEGFDIEIKEKVEPKTEEQIREEVKAEFEAEKEAEKELQEFASIVEKKVLPAHREAYISAFKASQGKDELIEFEEGKDKITESKHLKDMVSGMGDIDLTTEFAKANGKKEKTEKEKRLDMINKSAEQTKKMYGGK